MPSLSTLQPPVPPQPFVIVNTGELAGQTGPTAVWRAQVAQRKELRDQLDMLQNERRHVASELEDASLIGANRSGLEKRLGEIDVRTSAVDKQLAAADEAVAKAASIPGAVIEEPTRMIVRSGPPEEAIILGGIFIFVVLLPISIAYARRIWRRGGAAVAAVPTDLMDRMARLDQAVDAIAIEIERIGEGQRFMTRLFTDKDSARAVGAGPARHVPAEYREPMAQPLRGGDVAGG